jgi:hypothetical protein
MLTIIFLNVCSLIDHQGKINLNSNYISLSEKGLFSQRAVGGKNTKCSIIWKPREGWKGGEFEWKRNAGSQLVLAGCRCDSPDRSHKYRPSASASHPPSFTTTPPPLRSFKPLAPSLLLLDSAPSPVISSAPLPSPQPPYSRSLHA